MSDEPRILTDDESYQRRSQRGNRGGPEVTLCAEPGCPRAASWGPFCGDHRAAAGPRIGVAHDLTPDEYDTIRAQVEAKAAPLFLLAMDWIVRQQLAGLGVALGPVVISRDDR